PPRTRSCGWCHGEAWAGTEEQCGNCVTPATSVRFRTPGPNVGGVLLICGELQKRNKFQQKHGICRRAHHWAHPVQPTRARKFMAPDGPENAPPAISKRKADHLAL